MQNFEFENITYQYVLDLYETSDSVNDVYRAVLVKMKEKTSYNFNVEENLIKSKIRRIYSNYKKLYKNNSGHKDRFLPEFGAQIFKISLKNVSCSPDSSVVLQDSLEESMHTSTDNVTNVSDGNVSLPELSQEAPVRSVEHQSLKASDKSKKRKIFDDYAPRTKRQKLENAGDIILNDIDAAFRLIIRVAKRSNLPNTAALLECISNFDERQAAEAKKRLQKQPVPLTNIEAVAFMHEYALSVNTYIKIQKHFKNRHHNILPSYYMIKPEKYACHPANIKSSQLMVEAPLEDVLRHTVARLLLAYVDVLYRMYVSKQSISLTFVCSVGMDGSSEMGFFNSESLLNKNNNLLSTTLSYLLLYEKSSGTFVFNNMQSSSTRSNRPVKLELTKETKDKCKQEFNRIKETFDSLGPLEFDIRGMNITVNVEWIFSQIDGKLLSFLTDTSSTQVCQYCGATPLVYNTYFSDHQGYEFDPSKLIFGLGSLHLLLRSYGFFLDLGVRGKCKTWRRSTKQKEAHDKTNKIRIQKEMKEKLKIHAMFPKGNLGSTDTGNAARTAFKNHAIFAEILQIDPELVKRFYIILTAINVQYFVNMNKFRDYLQETEALYLKVILIKYVFYDVMSGFCSSHFCYCSYK